jgi:flavin reductase (DIM6/NTAB) family NADH-FMN oxidoreductase RutF
MTRSKDRRPAPRRRTATTEPAAKTVWKPGNMLAPIPVVLVSCGGTRGREPNLITIAWIGSVCSEPPMLSISVREDRHSHDILKTTGEFVVNIPSVQEAAATDWCGVVSGRDTDKFAGTGLTPAPALKVGCPIVAECPVNIECRVRRTLSLGSHTMFVAQVLAVQVRSTLVDPRGRLRLEKAGLVAFAHGHYYALGRHLGHFGFSVRKRTAKTRR